MMSEINTHDTLENSNPRNFEYTNIKPETNMTPKEAREQWDTAMSRKSEIGSELSNVKDAKADEDNERNSIEIGRENSESNGISSDKNRNMDLKSEKGMTFQGLQHFWDKLLNSERRENGYYSTFSERLSQTPAADGERGEWTGERGKSGFIPNNPNIKEMLGKFGLDKISYKDAIPDFSKLSEATLKIENMTENRAENFNQCDEKCAEQWNKEKRSGRNDWSAREVKQWRGENGYSWHERNDMKTCDLIPTKINEYFGHLGGVAECKKRDSYQKDGEYDE